MKKRIARIPAVFDSKMDRAQVLEKIKKENEERTEEPLYTQKGKSFFLWEQKGEVIYLHYYQNYRRDMEDTAFKGVIKDGLSGCRLEGYICKPRGVWAVFWCLTAVFVALLIGLPLILMQSPDIPLYYAMPFLAFVALGVYILAGLLMFDKKRLRNINDYLREFMKAENTDVLGEELAEELEGR